MASKLLPKNIDAVSANLSAVLSKVRLSKAVSLKSAKGAGIEEKVSLYATLRRSLLLANELDRSVTLLEGIVLGKGNDEERAVSSTHSGNLIAAANDLEKFLEDISKRLQALVTEIGD